jgi:cytosine/adenosine deaminase-related metal-dependent hydrolase
VTAVLIHTAPWVVPIAAPPIARGAVALDDGGRVRAIGPLTELHAMGRVVEHAGVLLPGLVNAHAHLELSHLRINGGDGLVPWIRRLLAARTTESSAEPAARAMAARGTVAVADLSNTGTLVRARGLEVVTFDERIAPRGEVAPPRPGCVITAHASYTCGAGPLRQIAALTGGRIATIHVEEDPAEAGWLVEGSGPLAALLAERNAQPEGQPAGVRPVAWLDALGVIGEGTLLVHLTFADDASLMRAARRGAIAVLCPRSNRHITGKLPPVMRIRAAGLRVALGTDSLASSPSLDVLGEVQTLSRAGFESAWLLECATVGGAVALGKPHLGALTVGRRPGLFAIGDHPVRDPIAFVAHEGADAPVERLA